MLRLRTLGRIDLRDDEGREVTSVLVQPKRLGLLAYLAVNATDGFQPRELLLPVFWPELSDERARNALRQALHQLRRALGPGVVLARGADAVGVNGSRLSCDAHAFAAALSRGALAEAVALYEGDLLPGCTVSGAGEFERWLDETRDALHHKAVRAAWALAHEHERTGDVTAAIESARRAHSLDPGDEAGMRQLLGLLARAGEREMAGEAYTAFARRLRRDAGREPEPATQALVDAIGSHVRPDAAAPPDVAVGRARVVIAPFMNLTGDAKWDFVGRLARDVVARGVVESRTADVRIVEDPVPSPGDAGFVVNGSYFLRDDQWQLQARVDAADGRVLEMIGDVEAPMARPWEAANALRRCVAAKLAGRLDPRFASWASVVTQAPDAEAHRELALGAELHLRGDFRAAIPHLLRAAARPDGFPLATLWAVQASCNLGEWEQAEALLAEVTDRARRGQLSPFEQLARDYLVACIDGQRGLALQIAQRGAALVPDSEVLSYLGRESLFCNKPRAAVEALQRLDSGRGWIPSWPPHWGRLAEAYHLLGDHARELEAARRGRAHHPDALVALLYEARAHAAVGDLPSLERCIEDACVFPADQFTNAGEVMLESARELRAHGWPADASELVTRAIRWFEGNGDARQHRDRLALARACYEGGRWEDARSIATELDTGSPGAIEPIGLRGTAAARLGDTRDARDALALLRATRGRFRYGLHHVWSARVLAVLGEAREAVEALRGGFARGYCHGIELHADIDLALLADEPSYRELMRPRG